MIRYSSIELRFGSRRLLRNGELCLYPGCVHLLLGDSGCGKTTLLRALAFLHPVRGMRCRWGDMEVTPDMHAGVRRTQIAYLTQEQTMLQNEGSLQENLELICALSNVRCEEEKRDALARLLGLNVEWDAAVTTLSRGERQRYGLLCACMKQAPLVLLDEPTSALDEEGVRSVCRLLEHLRAQGHTIVLSTHDPRLYPSAQYCYSFVDGRLQKETVGREEALSSKTPPVQTKAPLISMRVLSRRLCQKGSLVFGLCRIAFLCVLCLFPLLEEALFAQAGDAWISLANTAQAMPDVRYLENAPLLERTQVEAQVDGEGLPYWETTVYLQGRPFVVVPDPRLTQVMVPKGMASAWCSCTQMELVLQGEVHLISIVPDADVSESGETYVRVPYEWMSDQMMRAGVRESSTWLCSVDVRHSPLEQADVLRSAFPSASITVMVTREQELLRILLPWLSVLLWVLAVAGPLLFACRQIQRTRRKWHAWKLYGIAERHFLCLQLYDSSRRLWKEGAIALVLSLTAAGLLGHSLSACLPAFFALTLGYLLIVVLLPSLLLAALCYRGL